MAAAAAWAEKEKAGRVAELGGSDDEEDDEDEDDGTGTIGTCVVKTTAFVIVLTECVALNTVKAGSGTMWTTSGACAGAMALEVKLRISPVLFIWRWGTWLLLAWPHNPQIFGSTSLGLKIAQVH